MMTHEKARKVFATARNPAAGKPLENNTRLHKLDNGDFAIRLHSTDVVVIHADGSYTLNSGGWRTVTTKARINDYSPIRWLFQRKGIWIVGDGDNHTPFRDGLRIDGHGREIVTRSQKAFTFAA